ncbi:MAG: 30S ribosome-binding factor RbfA [Thiotrichaceae bacterium]
MPFDYSRIDRISEQIKRELAQIIRDKVKDPRVGMVSIMDVKVAKDLKQAKVYFDTLQEDMAKESEEGLNRAAGFLRRELARNLSLRTTPELKFFYDDTEVKADALSILIDKAINSDR